MRFSRISVFLTGNASKSSSSYKPVFNLISIYFFSISAKFIFSYFSAFAFFKTEANIFMDEAGSGAFETYSRGEAVEACSSAPLGVQIAGLFNKPSGTI